MTESYSSNERVLLRFQIENLQGKDFTVDDVWFELKDGKGKTVVTKDQSKNALNLLEGNIIQILFCPEYPSQYVLDIWYDIPVGGLKNTSQQTISTITERRTVRFLLPVVR